jgi:hypothetical protein
MTEEAATTDAPKLAPGHVLSADGNEYKRCPGLGADHVPDGAEIHQTHYAPLSEFGRNAGNADGLAWVCKTAQALYGKRSRENAAAKSGATPKPPRVAKPKAEPKAKAASGSRTKKSVAQAMADQSRRESEKKAARKRTPKAAPAPIVEDQPTAEEPVVE